MINDATEVERKLTTAKEKRTEEGEIRKDKEPEKQSSSNSQEARMDTMMKSMENLMERLTMDNRPPLRESQEKHYRNQNFRRPLPPPRNQRIPEDQ